jgi:hypothetical protein
MDGDWRKSKKSGSQGGRMTRNLYGGRHPRSDELIQRRMEARHEALRCGLLEVLAAAERPMTTGDLGLALNDLNKVDHMGHLLRELVAEGKVTARRFAFRRYDSLGHCLGPCEAMGYSIAKKVQP